MASFEKLIVMTVIFLSAVALAVTLSTSGSRSKITFPSTETATQQRESDADLLSNAPDQVPAGRDFTARDSTADSLDPRATEQVAKADGKASDPRREGAGARRDPSGGRPGSQKDLVGSGEDSASSNSASSDLKSKEDPFGIQLGVADAALPSDQRGTLSASGELIDPVSSPDKVALEQWLAGLAQQNARGETRILKSVVGLRVAPGNDRENVLFGVRDGDTWASLAEHLYGARRLADLLRTANDAEGAPRLGSTILVPVYEPSEAGRGVALEARRNNTDPAQLKPLPVQNQAPTQSGQAAGSTPSNTPREPSTPGTYLDYTVLEGDTLSGIAKKFYGEASKWQRIYDANRDVLPNPDVVRPGVRLRIP